ncbi:hypothetical protein B0H17DRAFT_1033094 [Mycena rosella]|uniref:Uncharacterized protein n=1 Tax=Mycena rosella TaxID=1033263 RepID=A0AAD7GXP1_MYCRO|nr:hypothetical protein B0H17DRAFT_1033094 [Mycena rosella]
MSHVAYLKTTVRIVTEPLPQLAAKNSVANANNPSDPATPANAAIKQQPLPEFPAGSLDPRSSVNFRLYLTIASPKSSTLGSF